MGMYPNVMYKENPETYGYPDRFDPEWSQRTDLAAVLEELTDRFAEEPGRHLHWYLIGKPMMFLSWNMVVGMGDVFIYPVFTSPYHESRLFFVTHQLMYWLHWPIMILASLAAIVIWLPSVQRCLSSSQIRIGRFCSVLIAYFVLVHVVGLPLPRYAIPLRPVMFGAAILLVMLVFDVAAKRRSSGETTQAPA